MQASYTNALQGIQLAQQGKRHEALSYLRIAVQTDTPHAEVWLWLAHVTPLREEYEHCVQQALALAPAHATAYQMLAMLRDASTNQPPLVSITEPPPSTQNTVVDDRLIRAMQRKRRIRRQRQLLFSIVAICGVLALAAAAGLGMQDMFLEDTSSTSTPSTYRSLEVTVTPTNRTFSSAFTMQLPTTWLFADRTSSAWQAALARDDVSDSTRTTWQQFETDLASLEINPADDSVQPPLTIIETDPSAIGSGSPARLQLVRLGAPYASMDNTGCAGIRQLADDPPTLLNNPGGDTVLEQVQAAVVQQSTEHCLFYTHYLLENTSSGAVLHRYILYVPAGETLLAEWHLTITTETVDQYTPVIEQLLQTIRSS
jgi:hypothetical protein